MVEFNQKEIKIVIDDTSFVVRFESDRNQQPNSGCLESESSMIQLGSPNRLSLVGTLLKRELSSFSNWGRK